MVSPDEVDELVLEIMGEMVVVRFNQLKRLVYAGSKKRIVTRYVSESLDRLEEVGKVVKKDDYYYLKGSNAKEVEEKMVRMETALTEYLKLTRNVVGGFGEDLVSDAIKEIISSKSEYSGFEVEPLEKSPERLVSYVWNGADKGILGEEDERRQIDILLKLPSDNRVNIEVKNEVEPIEHEEIDTALENSMLAREKWFDNMRCVETALVVSFIERAMICRCNKSEQYDHNNGANKSNVRKGRYKQWTIAEEPPIPFAITGMVYLPKGEHEEVFKDYLREFGYRKYEKYLKYYSIIRKEDFPQDIKDNIEEYILKFFCEREEEEEFKSQ